MIFNITFPRKQLSSYKKTNHITSKHNAGKIIFDLEWLLSYLFYDTDKSPRSSASILQCNFCPFPERERILKAREDAVF